MNNKELNIALGKLFNGIELDTHKLELGTHDDIMSDVSANGKSRSKFRQILRSSMSEIAKAMGHLENIEKRNVRIEKNSKKLEQDIKALGLNVKDIKDTTFIAAIEGRYYDREADNDKKMCQQAYNALRKTSESI